MKVAGATGAVKRIECGVRSAERGVGKFTAEARRRGGREGFPVRAGGANSIVARLMAARDWRGVGCVSRPIWRNEKAAEDCRTPRRWRAGQATRTQPGDGGDTSQAANGLHAFRYSFGKRHGLRYVGTARWAASQSPTICSFAGSNRRLRPSLSESRLSTMGTSTRVW